MVFSNTSTQILFVSISLYIYQKPKSLVVGEGRLDFSFLFDSCEIDRSQGRLVKTCEVTWEIRKVLRVDRQTAKIMP